MSAGLSHRRVIIVGSGQAGLSVAARLIAAGMRPQHDFVVIDDAARGQRSWASRWHSMELLSNARQSALPVRSLPGDQRRNPRADEMVDYLANVESVLGVQTIWDVRATAVERRGNGTTLHLSTTAGAVQTRNIVCATGATAHARRPRWALELSAPGVMVHSSEYLYPKQVPPGDVLIVGGGNSGVQLARELATSHTVTLSLRSPRRERRTTAYAASAGERAMLQSRERRPEPVFGERIDRLRRDGVALVPAVIGATGHAVTLADGTQMSPTSVILATGFGPGDAWLPESARAERPRRTLTGLPGLFVAGMPQYSGRAAGTLAGVWRDATTIARHITERP